MGQGHNFLEKFTMKRKFFDTKFASDAGLEKQMPRVVRYLVDNRNEVLSYDEVAQLASSIRSILKTPLSEVFDRIAASEALRNFAAIFARNSSSSLPEMLTTTSITIDSSQVNEVNTVRSMPELYKKIFVNLTPTLRFDKQRGMLTVSAVDNFQTLFVRGHLVASYQDSDGWLPPYIAEYAVKSYSMILSGMISKYYGLSLPETLKIMGVFAFYFCQMLSRDGDNSTLPPLFNRCTYIGNRGELLVMSEEICEFVQSINADINLSIDTVCTLIANFGPSRMAKFDYMGFKALCGGLGSELITSLIALEYPPYWIYLLVASLSGAKLPLIYKLNEHRLVNEGRTKFLQQLMSAEQLFAVRR